MTSREWFEKETAVFEGCELQFSVPPIQLKQPPRCYFTGEDFKGKKAQVGLDDDLLSKHLMFLGGIGTGKTNALFQIVQQIKESMTENDVMIIFDTKGDFYEKFYVDGSDDIVISNDDKATGSAYVDYWNIFNEIEQDSDRQEENVLEIAKTLFYEKIHSSKQPFFPNAAKDIFAGVLTYFIRSGLPMNNQALRHYFDTTSVESIREHLSTYDDLKSIASYIATEKNEVSQQTQGVVSELQQLTRELFLGNFKKDGDLSMRQLVREKAGKTVFIEYDLGVGNMLTPIYRLLFDMAIKEALSRRKSEGNVWFIADEFRLIPHLQHVDNAVNFGRSLGVKFMIGIQNVEQIFEVYGQHRARSIMSGFSSVFSFRLNDAASRHYVKDLFGRNRKAESYLSSVQSRGMVEHIRDSFVVEDWDLARLGLGEAVIGLPGEDPFVFRFSAYKG